MTQHNGNAGRTLGVDCSVPLLDGSGAIQDCIYCICGEKPPAGSEEMKVMIIPITMVMSVPISEVVVTNVEEQACQQTLVAWAFQVIAITASIFEYTR